MRASETLREMMRACGKVVRRIPIARGFKLPSS